mgnify:CR=1 FL=1
MAKYTGPKHRLARQAGINLLDKTSASLQRRLNTPPGVHGAKRKRKLSEFGIQLREKQKAKVMYGVLEKKFKNMVQAVSRQKGNTAELLIASLETRLDNVVYRLGFAKSRYQARQFVGHGHIVVNGKKLTIPSYQVQEGDIIALHEKIHNNVQILNLLKEKKVLLPFLETKGTVGKLVRMPKMSEVETPFDTRLIIEYYSR